MASAETIQKAKIGTSVKVGSELRQYFPLLIIVGLIALIIFKA